MKPAPPVSAATASSLEDIFSQELQLRRAGVPLANIHRDVGVSGTIGTQERLGWRRLDGRLAGGDTLVVVAIDRIGRTWQDIVRTICELRDLGVKLRSLAEAEAQWTRYLEADEGSPEAFVGQILTMFAAWVADQELESIKRRTRDGLERARQQGKALGPLRYRNMFHMTNDSNLFRTSAQLDAEGFYPVDGNRWRKGEQVYLPLYEGKMVQAFDHRAASVVVNPQNLNRPAQPRDARPEEHSGPSWLPAPQFWVGADSVEWADGPDWTLAIKHVSSPTNVRTVITALTPLGGYGNSLPIFVPMPTDGSEAAAVPGEEMCLLSANFNSFALDFVARQKLQGQNLNLFILEQLPVIPPDAYGRKFGDATAREVVLDHVLRLTYTANDMVPFARNLGYDGPPFIWNEDERSHLRARRDALFFHLYGLSRDDADYILSTFPIVQREDEVQFGAYRTRALVLAYMNALAAGDTESVIVL